MILGVLVCLGNSVKSVKIEHKPFAKSVEIEETPQQNSTVLSDHSDVAQSSAGAESIDSESFPVLGHIWALPIDSEHFNWHGQAGSGNRTESTDIGTSVFYPQDMFSTCTNSANSIRAPGHSNAIQVLSDSDSEGLDPVGSIANSGHSNAIPPTAHASSVSSQASNPSGMINQDVISQIEVDIFSDPIPEKLISSLPRPKKAKRTYNPRSAGGGS